MKGRNWTIGIMKVCLASGILFLPLPMEKLYAATVPDIRHLDIGPQQCISNGMSKSDG